MKSSSTISFAAWVLASALAAPLSMAQSAPTPSVMTDVAPLPAQERDSLGAIVLEDSMVPAQRVAFLRSGGAERYAWLTRGSTSETARLQREVELAESRAAADSTRVMGGPPSPATPWPKKNRRQVD
ncbi:MAG TPA: hypothetical protein VHA82_01910 [Ramlibacter sp.]|uniref:hypothetical protein n=1 Tax=Ramlibacter sp. TaxID=1917967 RepID=UPI002C5DAF80|nr:hypothetical protein [Ramlibacter sp.]HVZ42535.1 hypothetical protein [Ramlibacter sp.]